MDILNQFNGFNKLAVNKLGIRQKSLHWTNHAKGKMRFYQLSEQRIRRVLNSPKRVEEGIAPKTVAMMQPVSVKKDKGREIWKQEIWAMIEETESQRRIISAWRYPGMTKPRSEIALNLLKNAYEEFISSNLE